MDNKQVIEKIKRLLALANKEKNTSEAEAEAALLKAHELMAKYNIEMDETNMKEEISYVHEVCITKWNMGFRKILAAIIAQNFRCEMYIDKCNIVFFGHATDARIAKEVMEYAYTFAMREGNRVYNRHYQVGKPTKGVFNSYTRGFVQGLKQKLDEQSTALMVVTPPDVVKKFNEMSGNWNEKKANISISEFHPDAFNAGLHDGKTVMNGRRLQETI